MPISLLVVGLVAVLFLAYWTAADLRRLKKRIARLSAECASAKVRLRAAQEKRREVAAEAHALEFRHTMMEEAVRDLGLRDTHSVLDEDMDHNSKGYAAEVASTRSR